MCVLCFNSQWRSVVIGISSSVISIILLLISIGYRSKQTISLQCRSRKSLTCIFTIGFFLSFQIDILGSIFDDIFCSFMKQSKFAYRSAFFGSQPNEYYTIKFNFKFSVFFAAETLKGILTNCR
jgi:hypothetical protein